MGRATYDKCVELLKDFTKGDEIGFMRLQSLIMKAVGGDPRTISNTIRVMLDTKLLKDIGNSHFKIL